MTASTTTPAAIRGLFLGSAAGFAEAGMAEHLIELAGEPAAGTSVLYLGTATYDAIEPRARQTARFRTLGCRVTSLDIATRTLSRAEMHDRVAGAQVLLASGGNTLYAVDRWVSLGLDRLLRDAAQRGVVLGGGSAGAICWFDGGHSDSMDPTSYRIPVPADDPRARRWRYLRVAGLGLLPGLLCPHFEVVQRNGVRRASDFEAMLLRHPGERGFGLDDWAGLLVDGDHYRVVGAAGRRGSVDADQFVADGTGQPGLWLLEVTDGAVIWRVAPAVGTQAELLRRAVTIEPDALLAQARAENPVPTS